MSGREGGQEGKDYVFGLFCTFQLIFMLVVYADPRYPELYYFFLLTLKSCRYWSYVLYLWSIGCAEHWMPKRKMTPNPMQRRTQRQYSYKIGTPIQLDTW
uniref:Uncharacterized protein n=1 Tax=Cacopsylla melanoneura TaxID=428564 RepID=A0A8D9BUJ5_9HEMI